VSYDPRRPAILFYTCPACTCQRAEVVTADMVWCLGRVWSDDCGRFLRCEVTRYI
jgi:hypothetical protein